MQYHACFRHAGLLGLLSLVIPSLHSAQAGSATWSASPASSNWNSAANWNPNTVPNGSSDIATFGLSNTTSLSITAKTTVNSIAFEAGASAYMITASVARPMTISGTGISNASGIEQHFQINDSAKIYLTNSATIAASTVLNVLGSPSLGTGGLLLFSNSSSAGEATIVNGPSIGNSLAATIFSDSSTAGSAVITSQGVSSVEQFVGGIIIFGKTSTAGEATITCEGVSVAANALGGSLYFSENSNAGTATITANGGTVSDAYGGFVQFFSGSSFNSTLIANGGTNGGKGGSFVMSDPAPGTSPRVILFGNGNLNQISSVTIGSVEGDGLLYLGGSNLTVGTNGLSTIFSGVIQDGGFSVGTGHGSLTKTGAGTLTLTGANIYTGGTTISQGMLVVANRNGSGTGTEAVLVSAGTLAGGGTVSGEVTVGTGSGTGAFLAPAAGTKRQATFTTQSALTLQADATYTCTAKVKGASARTDEVVANGVTINGAVFSFRPKGQGTLPAGLVLMAIDNTSATPIAGTFGNLSDGEIITAGGNNFQASYKGDDGNDLTLTVVP
jgi:autotransporter-associated beta strand protein